MNRSLAAAALLATALLLCGCESGTTQAASIVTGGDPHRGAAAISRYGCGSCHTIGGISGANGLVGPPLTGIGSRVYVAGSLSNSFENLIRWIQDPHSIDDRTVMPNLSVTRADAADISAYLYTLK